MDGGHLCLLSRGVERPANDERQRQEMPLRRGAEAKARQFPTNLHWIGWIDESASRQRHRSAPTRTRSHPKEMSPRCASPEIRRFRISDAFSDFRRLRIRPSECLLTFEGNSAETSLVYGNFTTTRHIASQNSGMGRSCISRWRTGGRLAASAKGVTLVLHANKNRPRAIAAGGRRLDKKLQKRV
jgi:hypothetical protein